MSTTLSPFAPAEVPRRPVGGSGTTALTRRRSPRRRVAVTRTLEPFVGQLRQAPPDAGRAHDADRDAPGPAGDGGAMTLDDLVVSAWEGLSSHRTVVCPACGGAMAPRYGAGALPVGGRCEACATTLA